MILDDYSISQSLLETANISSLIPHQPPMVMVDDLYKSDNDIIISGFEIREDNILLEEGLFKESGILENMAQTVALGFSYKGENQEAQKSQMGYLISANRFSTSKYLGPGSKIITMIRIIKMIGQFTKAEGAVFFNNQQISKAEINLFQTNDKR